MLPSHLFPLFWDIDCTQFHPRQYPKYTILRVLEYGDSAAIRWLNSFFSPDEISGALCEDRRLSRRSARFWGMVYEVPENDLAALRAGSGAVEPPPPFGSWPRAT